VQAQRFASSREQRLFSLLLLCITIVALPSKFLYYASPPILIAGALVLEGTVVSARRFLLLLLGLSCWTMIAVAIAITNGHRINLPGILFGLVTYLPLIMLLVHHPSFTLSASFRDRLVRTSETFVFIQTPICVLQFVYGLMVWGPSTGDVVSGTFGLFDVFSKVTISQVLFTFTMFSICVFLAVGGQSRRGRIAIIFGILCCLLAQSGHQTIFFVLLLPALTLLHVGRLRHAFRLGAAMLAVFVLVCLVYPDTFKNITGWADKVLVSQQSPKQNIVRHVAREFFTADHVLFGSGIGQFTSRAALFSSGMYLQVSLPSFLLSRSDLFDEYIVPQMIYFNVVGEGSAMATPYLSILSLVTELGILPVALLIFVTSRAFARNLRAYRVGMSRGSWELQTLSFYCNFLIAFLICNAFIENYLELVQAISIPVILYIAAQGRIRALMQSPHLSLCRIRQERLRSGPRIGDQWPL
jgi:hypothetical protein